MKLIKSLMFFTVLSCVSFVQASAMTEPSADSSRSANVQKLHDALHPQAPVKPVQPTPFPYTQEYYETVIVQQFLQDLEKYEQDLLEHKKNVQKARAILIAYILRHKTV